MIDPQLMALLFAPLLGGLLLAVLGSRSWAAELNALMSFCTFAASLALAVRVIETGPQVAFNEQFFIDPFNIFMVVLTAFVAFTTSLFSRSYMRTEQQHGKLSTPKLHLYYCMYQIFTLTMLVALTNNNMGILWVAMEAATLSTVMLISLYRTPASLEAAWKYFILCGVGIALALFGTILLYFAAERVLGQGGSALLWTHLNQAKGSLEPTVLKLAFVFLLVGYGAKVGLAPLHNWLPDAHAESPTPVSAVLSGLLLNVALYAVVRGKILVDGALGAHIEGGTHFAGNLMMGFGLLSVVVGILSLSRQKDIKRLFAYSSIKHMGLITFAFGMGGPVATFAALLHTTVHSLTKSAIFFAAGHAAQISGTKQMESMRGLMQISPTVGWGLLLGTFAILGIPPFGLFTSEFLMITTAMHDYPWTTPLLLIVLGIAFAAILGKIQPAVFGETAAGRMPHQPSMLPAFAHLLLVLILGLYMPPYLADWFRQAVALLG